MTPPAPTLCARCRQRLIDAHETGAWLTHRRIQIYDQRLWLQCRACGHWNPAPPAFRAILLAVLGEADPVTCDTRKD